MPNNQPVILIASVLKPVSDPRMFEKFANSLHADYQIHIIGAPTQKLPSKPKNIHFHAPNKLERLSKNRVLFGYFFWQKLLEIKPNLLIINSPELLLYACLYKINSRKPIIYDIRENYFKNLWYQRNYRWGWRNLLAIQVRILEIFSYFFVNFYILAEKNYIKELFFCKHKNYIIENKFSASQYKPNFRKKKIKTLNFVYTGTVSKVYGTLEAIQFIQKLHVCNPNVKLTIIGHCSDKNYFQRIIQTTENQHFITLKIDTQPVPHPHILDAIQEADFGLLTYPFNISTKDCIPTKIYEFLAYQTPMLIPKNPLWENLVLPYQAGLSIDFQNVMPDKILHQLQNTVFFPKPVPESIWAFESEKLQKLVHQFLDIK